MTDRLLLTVNYSFTEKKYDDFIQADTVLPVMALAARLLGGGKRLAAFAR
ncbi:Uncharacterised protein [Salmonella enterica subsp. enterica serovar Typhi]|nr:Uncharacterised protein [Salmonella enterica subsp. enterica serovar Typhi]CZQ28141.1 Uncharacterised protein [Salmonella enterica subsp. enterica serovar Pullorum]CGZ27422.1 Uncharacterised protein [Salmonella enterica subsp. enterica serovar Typhi]CGZ31539.1 Uncharacterised protein [Salmonella enterica subsp. enterica serovar Typhi]CHF34539.1 Uncharacterised protein [Salmonella enterica subsp. enterica serovar Typhi]